MKHHNISSYKVRTCWSEKTNNDRKKVKPRKHRMRGKERRTKLPLAGRKNKCLEKESVQTICGNKSESSDNTSDWNGHSSGFGPTCVCISRRPCFLATATSFPPAPGRQSQGGRGPHLVAEFCHPRSLPWRLLFTARQMFIGSPLSQALGQNQK